MYYQHSGRFSVGGLLLSLAAGIGGGSALAYAYGSWLSLIPEVHLAAFATLAFGGLIGVATGLGSRWGHVRNKKWTLVLTAISTTFALYISWAFWIRSVFQREVHKNISWAGLAEHPRAIWHLMLYINQYGTWTLESGGPTKGWALWIVWFLEAATVIGIGMLAAAGMVQRNPYCETCGQWCRRMAHAILTPVQNLVELKRQLENKDFRAIADLQPGARLADRLEVELHGCSTCKQFHTLSASQFLVRKKKFANPNISQQRIVHHLIVGPTEAQTIRNLADKNAQNAKMSGGKARGATAGAR